MEGQYWDIYRLNCHGIKVSTKLPKELVFRILAAVLSYDMGNKSIDYTYKEWKGAWEKTFLHHLIGEYLPRPHT